MQAGTWTHLVVVAPSQANVSYYQIWFQNRRQITRRKSRPLLPHEVISNFYSNQYPNIAPSSSLCTFDSSLQHIQTSQSSFCSSQTTVDSRSPSQSVEKAANAGVNDVVAPLAGSTTESGNKAQEVKDESYDSAKPTELAASSNIIIGKQYGRPTNLTRSLSQTLPTKRHPGYFANRRSASFMVHDEVRSAARVSDSSTLVQGNSCLKLSRPSQPLERTSSVVRLSLSLDGKAEVTTRTGNTPSPQKPTSIGSRPHVGLQRSCSALEPGDESAQDPFSMPFPRRSMAGRSRDARTWEFYCDSDARNALTEQAERQESGDATAAISLIRSRSHNKNVMTPNPNKRNAHAQKPDFTKRLKAEVPRYSKPKLARAVSSVARLQTTDGNGQMPKAVQIIHKKSKSGSRTAIYEGDGDSDKENWVPGTRASNPGRRRPANLKRAAHILEESLLVPSQSSSLDALMCREGPRTGQSSLKSSSSEEKEDPKLDADDAVATLIGETIPREVEDLDCVQHLLSLSQAAWQ